MSQTVQSAFSSKSRLSAPDRCHSHLGDSAEIENREVEKRARVALEAHPHFHGRKRWIRCRFRDGRLYLTGTVPTYYLKQLAQEAIRQLDGVQEVVNQIVVGNPFAQPSENRRAARRIDGSNRTRRIPTILKAR